MRRFFDHQLTIQMEILVIVFSFIGSALGAIIISYLREKGKNYATKSDIGKITETVESIKSNYNKEQETLKAQLNLLVSAHNSFHSDIKRAIYEFWDSMLLLLSLCDTFRPEVDEERVAELDHFQREIEKVSNELQLRQGRLYLLIEDQTLLELSDRLFGDVSKYEGRFGLFLMKAKPWLEKMAEMHKQPVWDKNLYDSYWKEFNDLDSQLDKENEELIDQIDKNMELYKLRALELLKDTKKLI